MPAGIYERTEKHLAILKKEWDKKRGTHLRQETKDKISIHHIGSGNPFYGKKHTDETRIKISNAVRLHLSSTKYRNYYMDNIEIKPTSDWGYFIGLILGDGWVSHKRYLIEVGSTHPEIVDAFKDICISLGLKYNYYSRNGKYRKKNPRGTIFKCNINSKSLNMFFRECKLFDFHWLVPNIVLENSEILSGFLQGIYDAEGSISVYEKGMASIELSSKHATNLIPIKNLLWEQYLIKSSIIDSINRSAAKLVINEYTSRIKFKEQIGFRLKRKQDKLNNMTRKRKLYTIRTYLYAISLLQSGFSTKEITKRAKIHRNALYAWRDGKVPKYLTSR